MSSSIVTGTYDVNSFFKIFSPLKARNPYFTSIHEKAELSEFVYMDLHLRASGEDATTLNCSGLIYAFKL